VFSNNLSGEFPESMGLLTKMQVFNAHGNAFTGRLPTWIGNWQQLRQINLADNNLGGAIPTDFFRLNQTEQIVLSKNRLSATIDLFARFPRLTGLFLDGNIINGTLGEWMIESWKGLELLDISNCFVEGMLPRELFLLPRLLIVDIHDNLFNGNLIIPDEAENITKLEFLALHENQFDGSLSSKIGILSNLRHLGRFIYLFQVSNQVSFKCAHKYFVLMFVVVLTF
jgi:Leucine-rich repeat (LRR) protein